MKSYKEWLNESTDPEWDQLKHVWGGNRQNVDINLVNKMKMKIEGIKDSFAREMNDPNVQSFRDVPPNMRDSLAKSLVVAVLKAFYSDMGATATGSKGVFDQKKLGDIQQQQPAQPEVNAPAGWKGGLGNA